MLPRLTPQCGDVNIVKRWLLRAAYGLLNVRRKVLQPVTLGVRVLLVRDGQVLLVRHTYRDGWFLPGGGVKRRETLEAAARREAYEEVGATFGALRLMGAYSNFVEAASDHVVVFASESFELRANESAEIAECRFFPLTDLPKGVAAGTLRRIEEYLQSATPDTPTSANW
ncbi:MAG: NUDIX domain-containing protein [Anaerolineaceae bacterium]